MAKTLAAFVAAAIAVTANATAATSCSSKTGGGPSDAPTASLFGAGAYPWADAMVNWTCVQNIVDFAGDPDTAFKAAQAAAVRAGGGVVFFPAGTYAFTASLVLESNVVIRGAPTTAPAKAGKLPGSLAPATTFVCPDRQHLGIFNADPNSANIGVVNVDLDGCAVMLWPGLVPAYSGDAPGSLKTYWYDATAVAGQGRSKLVLSNRVRSVSYGQNDPVKATNPWPWRFSTAVAVYAQNNSLVANNLLAPSAHTATVKVAFSGDKVPTRELAYPYDNRYGIDNKLLLGGVAGKAVSPGGACPQSWGSLTPACAPWAFPAGVVWRGNWVFNNGRVSFNFYGGCNGPAAALGAGPQVVDNHSEHADGSTCYSVDGVHAAVGADTNENRGYDADSYCGNLTGNSAHVFRQAAGGTGYDTVDGECVLTQTENGCAGSHNLWDGNDCTHAPGASALASGYILYYKVNAVQTCTLTNNKAAAGFTIGAITDATHNVWTGNSCSGNEPAATVCDGSACRPC